MAGFIINASAATRLMEELKAAHVVLLSEVRKSTVQSGKAIQMGARGLVGSSASMPGLRGSIYTSTKQFASGTEVTVEAKSPFGFIREFGVTNLVGGSNAPRPFMLPAMMAELPRWEQSLAEATSRALR
jgi:hypothetical protein